MTTLAVFSNPAKRRSRKARSPAQKAATRKMLAANRARKNPAKHRARKAHHAVARRNPAKRYAVKHHARRTRRNPISAHLGSIKALVTGAGIGAAGALGVDVAFGFVQSYLPASLSTEKDAAGATNYGYYLAKGATAVAAAMALKKLIGPGRAAQVATGSLTVTLYRAMAQFLASTVPSVKLGMHLNAPGGTQRYISPAVTTGQPAPLRLAGMNMHLNSNPMRAREGIRA